MSLDEVKSVFPSCIEAFSLSELYDVFGIEKITEEYYNKEKDKFDFVLSHLEDEFSKESFKAFVKAKIFEDSSYLAPYIITPQYFFDNQPWETGDNEILVDGGAFNGDSLKDFLKKVKGKYCRIYECEPDSKNMEQLKEFVKKENLKNVFCIQKGLYSKKETLKFSAGNGMMSNISQQGETSIEVDTIDNILEGKPATIIKTDIEGAEVEALKGAYNTIKQYKPKLYISAYHKKDDPYNIIDYVNKIHPYKWFFGCHKCFAIDAVLYGIPKENI